ncbi:Hypothetical protein SRAE_X000120400 [Strongyloides ratti]|uniref:Uncharacterized protein n=1 Tax=Strongyloides ratti TaxID=34506 RepID=A0A090MN28_STRRB|nr:Hypothetical protein SRAE_X000120400 [Strongyloides ratti]CEF59456.1 Hypothetical protein SRAE_X000120400 [Strongyloides ratti]
MNNISLCFYGLLLTILIFTSNNVFGSDFNFPSRDIMKAMLRDPNAYFRGEPIRFGKKSSFREPIRFGKRNSPNLKKNKGNEIMNFDNENDNFDRKYYIPVPFYNFE